MSWLISVLKHFRTAIYYGYYKVCSILIFLDLYEMSSEALYQTMVVRNAILDSRWIKKHCLFVSIEIIDTLGVSAFETCVFNKMIQFKHTTQVLHIFIRKWQIEICL